MQTPTDAEAVPATARPPGKRATPLGSRIFQGVLTLVVVGLVFFVVLPNMADWDAVWDILQDVSAAQFAVIIGVALVLEAIKAYEQLILIPGLGFPRAFVALETSTLASNLAPGPTGTAMRYVVYRSWGFSSSDFARGWIVSSGFNNLIVLIMPVFGAILLVTTSDVEPTPLIYVVAVVGLVLTAAAVALIVGVLMREGFARRVGELAGRLLRVWRGLRKRPSGADAVATVLRFRTDAITSLHECGVRLGLTVIAKYALTALLLWFSLKAVGVPEGALSPTEVFAAYSFVRLFTIVDITPGSVGIAEALYVATLSYLANGEVDDAVIVAGVLIFRTATYVLPTFLGAGTYVIWRMKKSWRAPAPSTAGVDDVMAAAVDRPVED